MTGSSLSDFNYYKKCERCQVTIPLWQELCRKCSLEVYNVVVTPKEWLEDKGGKHVDTF